MQNRPANLIQHSTIAPASVIELLKSTLIGTEGSLYQLLDTEEKIHQLDQPHFFFIERNKKTLGTVTICERSVSTQSENIKALYCRYFAFDPVFQIAKNKKNSTSNSSTKQPGNGNSIFDKHWQKIFDSGNLTDEENQNRKTFFWAYVDPQNLRSFNMNARFGFETIGTFNTISFSRFYPKKNENVHRLQKSEQSNVLAQIRDFYSDYSLFSDVRLFDADNYFVFKENGKIVAGIHANPTRFKIVSLPGFTGKLLVKILPFLPIMKKIINPKNHRFLATEGIFWSPGHEDKIEKLLNGVLAITNHNSLLIWEDNCSSKIKNLPVKWGTLQRLKKNNEIMIVAKFINMDSEICDAIKKGPKYLSGFDMS